ncbi:type 1 glutamine amidotransferase domain-containing protein [Alloalcanivorax gelatiniphagus]|uniref:Type 1 glutamine amidotransferase domain-containing protein n=1 Tax=Alloalcanivorax gelatiniphagus TaxID=1194167 RepID=A0ABY2XHY6_9GAMM|nr:type 1 glutamine amidotransferase domain-containing protein [Alloalcanivorax gelatiniphagus]TMW11376.1 type 1 glutamine amidotransferase domain-containing protein [Alloalcanivorax gelatiniphagus]|tara:strand:- start:48672 stop:49346 length:675 start_codon:yes stop_codon:yes gene_type:complete
MNLDKPLLMLVTSASQMGQGQQTGLWLEEFAVPYQVFKDNNIPVRVASPSGGKIPIDPRSVPDDDQKEAWKDAIAELRDTRPLEEIWEDGFVAVFVPGGHGAMFDMPDNPLVAGVLQRTWTQGGVVAAVCHGPAALIGACDEDGVPLVKGRRVSCFTNEEEREVGLEEVMPFLLETRLEELGARIENKGKFQAQAVTDGRLVTGQNPPSSKVTAEAVVEVLYSE